MLIIRVKTIYTDSLLLISLDTYLGSDHYLYEGIPQYVRQEMDIHYLTSHVASKFVANKIPPTKDRSLLSQMIYYGKQVYLKERVMPQSTDAQKMGYTNEQIQWVIDNEVYMWQYFVQKQLLYNTDPSLTQRFIDPAPFSKFYLEIDNESPGRVGVWMGWQIIRSYMDRYPNTEISALLNLPAQTLFSKSNYKPKKIMPKKTSPISIEITVDENKVPEKIIWSAPDGGVDNEVAQAMLLALWDGQNQETLRVDLWIKEMPVDQMKMFFHQTLLTMSDTYLRATQDEKMTAIMKDFCDYFAEKLNLKKDD